MSPQPKGPLFDAPGTPPPREIGLPLPGEIAAITLWQPWATWIAWRWKTIETRTHSRFRDLVGRRIAIHAGKTFDEHAVSEAEQYLTRERAVRARASWAVHEYPHGAIVCTVRVAAARWLTEADSPAALCRCRHHDRFGIFLADVRPVDPPVLWRGAQRVWFLPASALPASALPDVAVPSPCGDHRECDACPNGEDCR